MSVVTIKAAQLKVGDRIVGADGISFSANPRIVEEISSISSETIDLMLDFGTATNPSESDKLGWTLKPYRYWLDFEVKVERGGSL